MEDTVLFQPTRINQCANSSKVKDSSWSKIEAICYYAVGIVIFLLICQKGFDFFFFNSNYFKSHEGKKNWKSDIITAHMTPCPVFFWAVCVFYFLLSFYICLSLPTTPLPPRSTSSEPIWPELQSIWAGKRKYLEHFTVHRFIMDQIILPRRSFLGKWASVTPL